MHLPHFFLMFPDLPVSKKMQRKHLFSLFHYTGCMLFIPDVDILIMSRQKSEAYSHKHKMFQHATPSLSAFRALSKQKLQNQEASAQFEMGKCSRIWKVLRCATWQTVRYFQTQYPFLKEHKAISFSHLTDLHFISVTSSSNPHFMHLFILFCHSALLRSNPSLSSSSTSSSSAPLPVLR